MEWLFAPTRVFVPLVLAAKGELIGQRAGILNLGVEGEMLLGAFVGWFVAHTTGSLIIGFLAAVVLGVLIGSVFWILIDLLECSQHVVGLGLGFVSTGLALSWYRETPSVLKTQPLPYYADTSLILLGVAVFLVILLVAIHFLQRTTSIGRAWTLVGRELRTADLLGIPVRLVRLSSCLYAVGMAFAGGAVMSVLITRSFTIGIISGRGWIALSIVILSQWRPALIIPAGALWAGMEIWQLRAQSAGIDIPHQLLLMSPYVASILVVVLAGKSGKAPNMLLKTYKRNEDAA